MQEIDRRGEILVRADRDVKGHDADAVGLAQLAKDVVEVRVLAIEATDRNDARRPGLLEI